MTTTNQQNTKKKDLKKNLSIEKNDDEVINELLEYEENQQRRYQRRT